MKKLIYVIPILLVISCTDVEDGAPLNARVVEVKANAAEIAQLYRTKDLFAIPAQNPHTSLAMFEQDVNARFGYQNPKLFEKIRTAKFNEKNDLVGPVDQALSPYLERITEAMSTSAFLNVAEKAEALARSKEDDYVYIEDLEGQLVASVASIENDVLNDLLLDDDEKLVIIASTSVLIELIPVVIEGATAYFEGEVASGRLSALKFLKKVVNAVATITRSTVQGIFSPLAGTVMALAIAAVGPWGIVVGAAAGGFVGSLNGVQCVQQDNKACYVCVFGTGSQPCP